MGVLEAIRVFLAACQLCTCPVHGEVDMGVDMHAHLSWECYQAQDQLKESLEKKDGSGQ